jgi:hypothetical protein
LPGKIVDEILKLLEDTISGLEAIVVSRIVMGLGYTAVELSTGNVGVCCTLQNEISPVWCQVHESAGDLAGTSATEIANMARSWDLSKSVLGVATMNALSSIAIAKNQNAYSVSKGNILDSVMLTKSDTVVFVGRMIPLIIRVQKKVKKIYVLERELTHREVGILPDTACEEILPKATFAIISGTTIANGTIDRLTELSKAAREIAVVGASASVLPDPLFKYGVTIVGGVEIRDRNKLLQIIAEGGGTKQLKRAVEFVNFRPFHAVNKM